MKLSYKFVAILMAFLIAISLAGLVTIQRLTVGPAAEQMPIMVDTGSSSGTYFEFIQTLSNLTDGSIVAKETTGTKNNLAALNSASTEFAIVQNDLAEFSYLGLNGNPRFKQLRYVLPLFPEYIRILVPADSDLFILGDLRGKKVCLGAYGSGTYYNAVDVLAMIDWVQEVDFEPVRLSSYDCINKMIANESIDAVFITSNSISDETTAQTREIHLPLNIIDKTTSSRGYYSKVTILDDQGQNRSYLSVVAHLATTDNVSSNRVKYIATEIVENWPSLRKGIAGSPDLKIYSNTKVPFHQGAENLLFDQGLKKRSYVFLFTSLSWLTFLFLSFYAEGQKTNYNRLGDSGLKNKISNKLFVALGKISKLVIGLSLLVALIMVAVTILRISEQYFAGTRGERSPFLDMGFKDNIVWLFTYISSGFASDGIYPQSTIGQIIVASLAILGIVGPITGMIFIVNFLSKQTQKQIEGVSLLHLKKHVVICGWNEKAPGIIYTLTGSDVDKKKNVVIVANFKSEFPLEKYQFNNSRVKYCKGNGVDIKTLERAQTKEAEFMIVLADYNGGKDENIGSILTVMNGRKLNEGLHICAEMEYEVNRDMFKSCGCDTLISPRLITARLAASAVISPLIIDYFLDIITYHTFDEVYSARVGDEEKLHPFIGGSIRDLELALFTKHMNLVGILTRESKGQELYQSAFSEMSKLKALVDTSDSADILSENNWIIYSAKNRAKLKAIRSDDAATVHGTVNNTKFHVHTLNNKNVMACGDLETLNLIEKNLKSNNPDINFVAIDLTKEPFNRFEDIRQHFIQSFDKVIILVPQPDKLNVDSDDDLDKIDAKTLLRARLVHAAIAQENKNTEIIAEVMSIKNRGLFLEHGITDVLPTKLVVERLMTKEIYDKSNILEYYLALLNLRDGVHLHAHTVEGDDGFCNTTYSDLLHTEIEGLRVIGWLPVEQRENKLRNQQGDFRYHFRTVLDERIEQEFVKEGDVLILIVRNREKYYSN